METTYLSPDKRKKLTPKEELKALKDLQNQVYTTGFSSEVVDCITDTITGLIGECCDDEEDDE